MNKKAIFMPTLAIAILFIVTYIVYTLCLGQGHSYEATLGGNQIALTNTYKEAENDLMYTEQAIKYILSKTTEKFSNEGGVKASCNGQWILEDDNCDPKLEKNFEEVLKGKLKAYNLELQEFNINNNIIMLKLKDKIYNNSLSNFEYSYKVKQEFKQESLIDFARLNKIKNDIDACTKSSSPIGLRECVKEKSEKSGDIIYFTIENNKNIFSLSTKEFKKIDFKFNINENSPRKKVL